MADHFTHANEYCNLIRLETGHTIPSGFTLVSTAAPAILTQLCRIFTLARGLTLYEVWDSYNETTTGYLVHSFIAELASEYRTGVSTERWVSMRLHQRARLQHARALLLERFPRMPDIAVIRIAERAQREHWNGEKKKLEERVVNCVRHEWTSYEVRLGSTVPISPPTGHIITDGNQTNPALHPKKDEVFQIVKPRIRDVLMSWLPTYIDAQDLARFWQRHQLFDSTGSNELYSNERLLVQTSSLRYHGGLETPANLLAKTKLVM